MTVGASRMRVMLDAEQGRAVADTPASSEREAPAATPAKTAADSGVQAADNLTSAAADIATPTFVAATIVEQATGG